MLQKHVIDKRTLDLLEDLMLLPSLRDFNLVGGTALALLYGHRHSIDLDLFGKTEELPHNIISSEINDLGNANLTTSSSVMIGYFIDNIKVDIVKYNYDLIRPIIEIDGIRLASSEDIAAMKLAAITGRGKKKDFFDLYELLKHFSFTELFSFYDEKYPDGNRFLVIRSLCYFEDADQDENPILYNDLSWELVKESIKERYKAFLHKH